MSPARSAIKAGWVPAVAARVKASYALSYADAFAVATAVRLQATVVTGDAEFACVEELVEIRWI